MRSQKETHWSEYLHPWEAKELDRIELAVLSNKEELAALRKKQRGLLERGRRRQSAAPRKHEPRS